MYLEHFNLKALPFENASDPAFFVLHGQYRTALAALLYGIVSGKGLLVVVGPSGCGKTTLSYTLQARLPDEYNACSIVYLGSQSLEITRFLAGELDVPIPDGSFLSLAKNIRTKLLEEREKGRRNVLIIDEAQLMSAEAFREILFLSNQETPRHKLLQIILMGRPELMRRIKAPQFEPLSQRISVIQSLEPLDWMRMVKYIQERLRTAGRNAPLFTSQAFSAIYSISKGTPRTINKICDQALLNAFLAETSIVKVEFILQAARELDLDIPTPILGSVRKRPMGAGSVSEVLDGTENSETRLAADETGSAPAAPSERSGACPPNPVPEPACMVKTNDAPPSKPDSSAAVDREHSVHAGGTAAISILPRRTPGIYQAGLVAVALCTVLLGWGLLRVASAPTGFKSISQPAMVEKTPGPSANITSVEPDTLKISVDRHLAQNAGDGPPVFETRQPMEKPGAEQMNPSPATQSAITTSPDEPTPQPETDAQAGADPAGAAPIEQSQAPVEQEALALNAPQSPDIEDIDREAAGNANANETTAHTEEQTASAWNPSPYSLQVSTFFHPKTAARAMDNLRAKGLSPYTTIARSNGNKVMYRIYCGTFRHEEDALAYARKFHLNDVLVRQTPFANQIVANAEETEFQAVLSRLSDLGYFPYVMTRENGERLLLVGVHSTREEALELSLELKEKGIQSDVIER